ncbi:hypothetical protein ABEG18_21885 [Alsobacter sp. KACC 23698]|uniref:DUF4345 domain-containing protein n=1 Tax=Alsobacter sp. KACC 23698 TaxID=3149229 RepID=A0AAU7JD78_9HYPH
MASRKDALRSGPLWSKTLAVAAVAELGTGLALVTVPSLVGQLLFGQSLTGVAGEVARFAGLALVSLGIACWPGRSPSATALVGMWIYSLLTALYLAYLGLSSARSGALLWPAVAVHLTLAVLLGRQGLASRPG